MPDLDATQQGVSADDNQSPDGATTNETLHPDSPAARRLAAMDSIRMTRVAELEAETGVPVALDDESERPAPAEPEPEQAEQARQIAQQMDDDLIDDTVMRRKVRLKIDGEEVTVPLEQLVRDAQKAGAADRRLAQATELLRRVQESQQQTNETAVSIPPSPAPSLPPDEMVRGKVKVALDAIFSGDEDAAANALAEVLAARQPQQAPTLDPDALAEVVTQRLDERSALDRFLGTYQRIAANPWLQQAADAELARLRAEGLPFAAALDQAGKAVYSQFGYEIPQAGPQNQTPTADRRETLNARKAGLDIPVGRTVSAAPTRTAPESSESERSMTIAEMAAARRGERPGAGR